MVYTPRDIPKPGIDAYGGSIADSATVGVASAQILRPNNRRKSVIFTNLSTAVIYLAKGENAVVGTGLPLTAYGSVYAEPDNRGRIWYGSWHAIASGAGSALSICEDF